MRNVLPMIPTWLVTVRGRVPHWAALALGALPIAVLLALWALLTAGAVEERRISPTILPSPAEVLGSIPELVQNRDSEGNGLLHPIGRSLERVASGYAVALAVILPLGIFMGSLGSVRAMFNPVMTASGYIPIATLVPLTMSWFGTGEQQKVMFLALAFAIYLLPLVVAAI